MAMSDVDNSKRRWPYNSEEEDNNIDPYDELEDVKRKDDDNFNDW